MSQFQKIYYQIQFDYLFKDIYNLLDNIIFRFDNIESLRILYSLIIMAEESLEGYGTIGERKYLEVIKIIFDYITTTLNL